VEFNQVIEGDIRTVQLPDQSVNCIVTSPPYWNLRNYHIDGQVGLETTPEEYVQTMISIFHKLQQVLRDDGTLWLNLGDSYAGSGQGWGSKLASYPGYKDKSLWNKPATSSKLKPKNLVGIPWRVALALQADGWYLRQDIIWHKPNAMPESVKDRCTKTHEYIFLLTKSAQYYYNADAIRTPLKQSSVNRGQDGWHGGTGNEMQVGARSGSPFRKLANEEIKMADTYHLLGANKRSVWTVATKPYKGAHFATFPPDLVRPCILAGCPPGGVVLDPFMGSGTVAQVAIETGRNWLGVELNPEYIKLAEQRIGKQQRLF